MPNDNIRKVYDALASKYTNMAQPYEEFESMMTDEQNRKKVYDALSSKYKNMAQSWDEFNTMLTPAATQPTPQPTQAPAAEATQPTAAQPVQPAQQQPTDTAVQTLARGGYMPRGMVPSSKEQWDEMSQQAQEIRAREGEQRQQSQQWAAEHKEEIDAAKEQMKEERRAKWQKFGEALLKSGSAAPGMTATPAAVAGGMSPSQQMAMENSLDTWEEYGEHKLVADALDEAVDYARAAEKGKGLGQGFIDMASRPGTWDFGYSDITKGLTLQALAEKWESGEPLSEQEEKTLDMVALATYITENAQNGIGIGYNVGASLPQSLGFMASLALNPASGLGRKLAQRAATKFGKAGLRALGDIAEMGVATVTSGGGRTLADALDRVNGSTQYEISPEGYVTYGGQADREELGRAALKAFGNNFIENYTEAMGEYFTPLAGMLGTLTDKGMRRIGLGKMADFLNSIPQSQWGQMVRKFKDATKFNGIVGEVLEEEIGMFMEPLVIGDTTLGENFNVWSSDPKVRERARDNQLTTILSCALMSGALYGVEAAGARSRIDRELRNADHKGSNAFAPEEWAEIKGRLDNADPEQLVRELKDIVYNPSLYPDQRRDVVDYAAKLMQTQQFNTASEKAKQEMDEVSKTLTAAYDAGYRMGVMAEPRSFRRVNDALIYAQSQVDRLGLGDMAAQLQEADAATRSQVLDGLEDEQRKAVEFYLGCSERQKGLYEGVQFNADSEYDAAVYNLAPAVVTAEDGTRTITSATAADGRFVYVISQDGAMSIIVDEDGGKEPYPTDQLSDLQVADADAVEQELRKALDDKWMSRISFYEAHNEKTQEPQIGMVIGDGDETVIVTDMGEGWATVQQAETDKDGNIGPKPNGTTRDVTKEYLLALQDQIYDKRDMMDGVERAGEAEAQAEAQMPDSSVPSDAASSIRARAEQWAAATGVSARMIERAEDVDNAQVLEALAKGVKVSGWYNTATGEVCFYMPNIMDASEVDKTFIHEVVGHKGMRLLLGEQGYAELCGRVWNELMSEEDKQTYLSRLSSAERSEQEAQLAAADEFIAYFAERVQMNPTEEDKTLWDRFVQMVQDILSRLGLGEQLTTEDLSGLLQASLARYREEVAGQQQAQQPSALESIPSQTDEKTGETDYEWAKAPDVQTAIAAMKEAGYDDDVIRDYANDMIASLEAEAKKLGKPKAGTTMAQRQQMKADLKQNEQNRLFWQAVTDAMALNEQAEEEAARQQQMETEAEQEAIDAYGSDFKDVDDALNQVIDEMDFESMVRYYAAHAKYIWADSDYGTKGFASHMFAAKGNKRSERLANIGWLANRDKGGYYPEEIAERIFADLPESIKQGHDEMEALDIIISTIQSANHPATVVRDMYANLIQKQQEAELAEQRRIQEEEERQQDAYARDRGFANYQEMLTFEELWASGEDIVEIPAEQLENYYNTLYGTDTDAGVGTESQGVVQQPTGQNEDNSGSDTLVQAEGSDSGSIGDGTAGAETGADTVLPGAEQDRAQAAIDVLEEDEETAKARKFIEGTGKQWRDKPLTTLAEVKWFLNWINYNGSISKVLTDERGDKFVKYQANGSVTPNIYLGKTTPREILKQFLLYDNIMQVNIPTDIEREFEREQADAKKTSDALWADDRERIKNILTNAGISFHDVIDSERGSRIVFTDRKNDNGNYLDYMDVSDADQAKDDIEYIRNKAEQFKPEEMETPRDKQNAEHPIVFPNGMVPGQAVTFYTGDVISNRKQKGEVIAYDAADDKYIVRMKDAIIGSDLRKKEDVNKFKYFTYRLWNVNMTAVEGKEPSNVMATIGYYHNAVDIAHGIKEGNQESIDKAAKAMKDYLNEGDILVPMPSHTGKAENTAKLAEAIAKLSTQPNVTVVDGLVGTERQSLYETKKNGGELPKPSDMGFQLTDAGKEAVASGRRVVIIDNVIATGTTAQAALQAIPGSIVLAYAQDNSVRRAEEEKPDTIRFREANDRASLMGAHNITADNLKNILKRGGLANPSMAVVNTDNHIHTNYGEISLIPYASRLDASQYPGVVTYSGDAYTPNYPHVVHELTDKGEKKIWDMAERIGNGNKEVERFVQNNLSNHAQDNGTHLTFEYAFEHGLNPEVVYEQPLYSKEEYDRLHAIVGDKSANELTREEKDKVLDILIADKQKSVDESIEKLKSGKKGKFTDKLLATLEHRVEDYRKDITYEDGEIAFTTLDNYIYRVNEAEYLRNHPRIDSYKTRDRALQQISEAGLNDDYWDWVEDLFTDEEWPEKIFVGYTPSGTRRYVPNTLENASRLMNKEPENNAEDWHGYNATRSLMLKKMRTLSDIRKYKDLLTAEEDYHDQAEKMSDEWTGLVGELSDMQKISDNPFSNMDYAEARIQEAMLKSNPIAHLNREYGYHIDKDSDFGKRLLDAIFAMESAPAKYFETKFKRPVYLNEFKTAIVPDNLDKELRDKLSQAGINVVDYAHNDLEDRINKTRQATEGDTDVRFRVANENQAIFISNAAKAVENIKQEKATPDQWLAMIQKQGGIKAGEDKWLNNSVRKIFAGIDQEGNRVMLIHTHEGPTIDVIHDDNGNIISHNNAIEGLDAAKNISDLVGEEIASDALTITGKGTENGREYKDDALRVGISGMQGFYDKMLPAFMTKYGKQWGVKPELQEFPDIYGKWWTIDVTPEMRASVMEGQTMFRIGNNEQTHELNAKQKQPGEEVKVAAEAITADIMPFEGRPVTKEEIAAARDTNLVKQWEKSKNGDLTRMFGPIPGFVRDFAEATLGIDNKYGLDDRVYYHAAEEMDYIMDYAREHGLDAAIADKHNFKDGETIGRLIEEAKPLYTEKEIAEIKKVLPEGAIEALNGALQAFADEKRIREEMERIRALNDGKTMENALTLYAVVYNRLKENYEGDDSYFHTLGRNITVNPRRVINNDISKEIIRRIATAPVKANLALEDMSDAVDDIRFRLSNNNRKVVTSWLNKRTDLTEAEKAAVLNDIDNLEDAKTQLATGWWFAKGTIRLPEDMPKVEQAVQVATIAKVDPLKYSSPMELINAHANIQVKEKPINPDKVSTLHKYRELPDGIVIYDVDDTEESRKNMRAIIDTHFGKESSPWCLLQGDGEGGLTRQSKEYWDYYNSYPKQVAFKDGKLLAFSANRGPVRWWDRMDSSHVGIPVEGKIPNDELGRSGVLEYDPIDGEATVVGDMWKGNPENGPFEKYYDTGQLKRRSTRKDTFDVGPVEVWHKNGQKSAEFTNNELGNTEGEFKTWYPNGQLHTTGTMVNGRPVGVHETYFENGQLEMRTVYPDTWKGNEHPIEPRERFYPNGQIRSIEPYDENGIKNGTETEWFEDGKKEYEVEYVNNEPKSSIHWFQNGDVESKKYWDEDGHKTGVWEKYNWNWDDKKSVLVERTHYNKGFKDGLYEEFYNNGNPKTRYNFVDGVAKGLVETWNNDGKPFLRKFVQQPRFKEIGHEYYNYDKNEVSQLYTYYDFLDTPHNYTKYFPMDGYKPLTAEELATYPEWVKEEIMPDPTMFREVTDPLLIETLEAGKKQKGYRTVAVGEDGTLGSPMAGSLGKKGSNSVKTSRFELGKWEQAEENPQIATEDGKVNLIKPNRRGSVGGVDYNPYIHIRPTSVNKQFTQAWSRPELAYIETEYPERELTSGYKADKAKLSVGRHPWNGGELILSRWDKPTRVIPWEEVADEWAKEFKDSGVTFDIVSPHMLDILAGKGVKILPPKKAAGKAAMDAYKKWLGERGPEGGDDIRMRMADEALQVLDAYENGEGLGSYLDLVDSIENSDVLMEDKTLSGLVKEYRTLQETDRLEGRRDYTGGEMDDMVEDEIIPRLRRLVDGDTRFREAEQGSLFSDEEMNGGVGGSQRSVTFARNDNGNERSKSDIQRQGGDNGAQDAGRGGAATSRKAGEIIKPLRKLKEGETCLVERKMTEDKNFSFIGPDKIETSSDVAYIFKELENKAIENAFLVFQGEEGTPAYVLHVGMGTISTSAVDLSPIIPMLDSIKPQKIWLVHNHPSGQIKPSRQDNGLLQVIRSIVGIYAPEVAVQPGIIIDTTRGVYGEFDGYGVDDILYELEASDVERKAKYPVYKFDEQAFSKDYEPDNLNTIRYSGDVAKFVATHRLGERSKINILVLNTGSQVVGNFFSDVASLDNSDDAFRLARECGRYMTATDGTAVIVFGTGIPDIRTDEKRGRAAKVLNQALKQMNIPLLDMQSLDKNDPNMDFPSYYSYAEHGAMEEMPEYGDVRMRVSDGVEDRRENESPRVFVRRMQIEYRKRFNEVAPMIVLPEQKLSKPEIKVRLGLSPYANINKVYETYEDLFKEGRVDALGWNLNNLGINKTIIFAKEDQTKARTALTTMLHENVHAVISESTPDERSKAAAAILQWSDGYYGKNPKDNWIRRYYNKWQSDSRTDEDNELIAYVLGFDLEDGIDRQRAAEYVGGFESLRGYFDNILNKIHKEDGNTEGAGRSDAGQGRVGEEGPGTSAGEVTEKETSLKEAEEATDTNPTEAQKEAGNYRKGHVRLFGMDLSIENPEGSERHGVDKDGKEWSQRMNNTYGYIRGTMGRDKDHIDFFLGPDLESDNVYIVDQRDVKTGAFDEHKVMLGFDDIGEARDAYNSNYEEGWQGLGAISELSMDEFKEWAFREGRRVQPYNGDVRFRVREEQEYERIEKQLGTAAARYERAMDDMGKRMTEVMQDSMKSVDELQKAIEEESGKPIRDYENAYWAAIQYSSRNKAAQEAYDKLFWRPLMDEVSKLIKGEGDVEAAMDELNAYLLAKHGLERNEVFARRDAKKEYEEYINQHPNGKKTEDEFYLDNRRRDYSGLTALMQEKDVTKAEGLAQALVDSYEMNHDTTELWKRINAATKETLRTSYNGGLLSEDKYKELLTMFQNYVPLRGFDETTSDDVYGYYGTVNSPYNTAIKHAKGRRSLADSPLATIANIADSEIMRSNRNRIYMSALALAEGHRTPLLSVSEVLFERNQQTGMWEISLPQIDPNDTPEEVAQKMAAHRAWFANQVINDPANYRTQKEMQNVPYKVISKAALSEHQILATRAGKQYIITVNGNPRAAQALAGQTNPDSSPALQWLAPFNRFLASVFTQYNPSFVLRNLTRDGIYTNSLVWVKESPEYARKYNKNWGKSLASMASLLKKYNNGTLDDNVPMERYFKEFIENGGETGYTQLRSVKDYKKIMARELKDVTSLAPAAAGRKVMTALGDAVENMNRWAEGVSRFAAYMTSREQGRSVTRSVEDAKEISVNFNKKGSGMAAMTDKDSEEKMLMAVARASQLGRELYVFFNAGVQGMANAGSAVKNNPGKATALMTSLFLAGMALAMMNGGDGDDDDEKEYYNLPEYVRRSNICLKVGKHWLTIPLPIELRALYGLGELAYSVMTGNEYYEPKELAYEAASQLSQILPIDFLEGNQGTMAFIPSPFKPVIEAYWLNQDWTGAPIYNKSPYNEDDPEWRKAYKSTNPTLVTAARKLNEWTGGNIGRKGVIDINPARIEHLFEGYLGGVGTILNQAYKLASAITDEDMREVRNIPVVSGFVRDADGRAAQRSENSRYYKINKYVDEVMNEDRRLRQMIAEKTITGYDYDDKDIADAEKRLNELHGSDEWTFVQRWKNLNKVRDAVREAKDKTEAAEVLQKKIESLSKSIGKNKTAEDSLKELMAGDVSQLLESLKDMDEKEMLNNLTKQMNDLYREFRKKKPEEE